MIIINKQILFLNEKENDKRYKKVEYVEDANGCWIAVSHFIDEDGYARFSRIYNKIRYQFIHRLSYVIYKKDEIRDEEVVRHICNNPTCINPDHLEKGSTYDNMQDRKESGNYNVGEGYDNKTSKLNKEQVELVHEMLNESIDVSRIAEKLNVSTSCIRSIKNGRTWSHITNIKKKDIVKKELLHTVINSNNTSGCRGVSYSKTSKRWSSSITVDKIKYNLGYFDNKEDAIKARKEAENKFFNN